MKQVSKILSLLLAAALAFTFMPLTVFAEGTEETTLDSVATPTTTSPASIVIASFEALPEETLHQGYDFDSVTEADLDLPDTVTGTDADGNAVTIESVTWESEPEFNPEVSLSPLDYPNGYEFTPVLPEGYSLAEGVTAPMITVIIKPEGGVQIQQLAASGSISIGGQTNVQLNADKTLSDGWSWDAATDTLTLDDYDGGGIDIDCGSSDTIKLVLEGESTVNNTNGTGISCEGSLIISGSGKATVTGIAIGINIGGHISISADVEARADTDESATEYGIYAKGYISINGGKVVVYGQDYGLFSDANVTISGGEEHDLRSEQKAGIYAKNVSIRGGRGTVMGNAAVIAAEPIDTLGVIVLGYDDSDYTVASKTGASGSIPNTFLNAVTNAILTNISFSKTATHTVTFNLNGGTKTGGELTQYVEDGGTATAPTVTRGSYRFDGWDKPLTNITSTQTITAQWSYIGGRSNNNHDDNDNDDDSGSSYKPPVADDWLDPDEARPLAANSKRQNLDYARTFRANRYGVRGRSWTALKDLRFYHDTVLGGAVQVRTYFDDPALFTKDVRVSGYVAGFAANSIRGLFEKWFTNEVRVIHFDQAGEWENPIKVAAKVDLAGMDTTKLVLYSYDPDTNSYRRIVNPEYWIDVNGYLHFETAYAGEIVISEGELIKR